MGQQASAALALAQGALGEAVSATQLQRTAAFCALWSVLSAGGRAAAPAALRSHGERNAFGARVAALVHAITTIALAGRVIASEELSKDIDADHMYGASDGAMLLFAHSCGYFAWDIVACFVEGGKINWGFVLHAVSCFLCYLFGQFPYLQYYGVRFLLFELSTPFLNAMYLLRKMGQTGLVHDAMQALFGLSFVLARIAYGLPLSFFFFRESLDLLRSGRQHSTFVVVFYLIANIALNSLNLFWLYIMQAKRAKSS